MNRTPAAFSFRGLALPALIATSVISALGFIWPFLISTPQARPQWLFAIAVPCALLLLFASVSNNKLDTKSIALLAVLAAVIAALRPMGTGAVGIEPMWFLLILAARVFGPSFGFLLGALSMVLSAFLTGGVGPWGALRPLIATGLAIVPFLFLGQHFNRQHSKAFDWFALQIPLLFCLLWPLIWLWSIFDAYQTAMLSVTKTYSA